MNKRPRSITVISWIFIAFGSIALLAVVLSLADTASAQRVADLKAHWMVHVARFLALLGGYVYPRTDRLFSRMLLIAGLILYHHREIGRSSLAGPAS